jgi:hypothetical protein
MAEDRVCPMCEKRRPHGGEASIDFKKELEGRLIVVLRFETAFRLGQEGAHSKMLFYAYS